MYMNFGGSGDQGCPEPSQYRVLGAASLLPHPPYWLQAQTPPQHRAPWGLSNLLGGWHIRRHLGPSLVRYLLKMVPVHGKTISNDRLGPGAWPPSSSTSSFTHLLWKVIATSPLYGTELEFATAFCSTKSRPLQESHSKAALASSESPIVCTRHMCSERWCFPGLWICLN